MSDNRKYYYLKLKESYFDDDAIVLLESMQDGKIKVAERVAPEREEWGWDTGWGFFSDDDDEIEDDENGGFYDIRDICRIDPTVVPLLSLPYGTCMEKDETGEWIEIEDDETERS